MIDTEIWQLAMPVVGAVHHIRLGHSRPSDDIANRHTAMPVARAVDIREDRAPGFPELRKLGIYLLGLAGH